MEMIFRTKYSCSLALLCIFLSGYNSQIALARPLLKPESTVPLLEKPKQIALCAGRKLWLRDAKKWTSYGQFMRERRNTKSYIRLAARLKALRKICRLDQPASLGTLAGPACQPADLDSNGRIEPSDLLKLKRKEVAALRELLMLCWMRDTSQGESTSSLSSSRTFSSTSSSIPSDPPVLPACADLLDNDADGLIDYPHDNGCFSENDNSESADFEPLSECAVREICSNNSDDNCNGQLDESPCLAINARITSDPGHSQMIIDSYAAGEMVDKVDFRHADISGSFPAHNGSFVDGNYIEWDAAVPRPGYYLLSFLTWSRPNERTYTISYFNGESQTEVQGAGNNWLELFLLEFKSAGNHRIRAQKQLCCLAYPFHARLFALRKRPQATPAGDYTVRPRFVSDLTQFRHAASETWLKLLTDDSLADARYMLNSVNLDSFSGCDSRWIQGAFADLSVAYHVSGDSIFVPYAIQALRNTLSKPNWYCGPSWSSLSMGEIAQGVSLAFDAFSSAMTAQERTELIELADLKLAYLFFMSLHSMHRGDNTYWWSDPTANNWNGVINGGGLGSAAMAFLADNRYAGQWLDQAVLTVRWFLENNFDNNGAYSESIMYNAYGLDTGSPFLSAVKRLQRVDLFSTNESAIRNNAYYRLYMLEPNNWNFAPFNDGTRWDLPARYRYAHIHPGILLAAREYQDGILQRFSRKLYGDLKTTDRYHDYAAYLPLAALGFGDISETPDGEWNLATSRIWPEFGKLSSRSEFGSNLGAYFFAAECGAHGVHAHADQGTFIFSALGQNFIDDNNYGSPESQYQNVLLIDGLGQKTGSTQDIFGAIEGFLSTPLLDFATINPKAAYPTEQISLDSYHRHFFFRKPNAEMPGYLVVSDDLRSQSSHTYEWRAALQKWTTPVFTVSQTSPGIFSADANENPSMNIPDANLDIVFMNEQNLSFQILDGFRLTATTSQAVNNHAFMALLFPTTPSIQRPSLERHIDGNSIGFQMGPDILLMRRSGDPISALGVSSDAALVFKSAQGEAHILAFSRGMSATSGSFSLSSNIETSAVAVYQPGHYQVLVGNELESAPSLQLSLQGVLNGTYQLSVSGGVPSNVAVSNQQFTITVPAGAAQIQMDLN